jgi:hypothetical protein
MEIPARFFRGRRFRRRQVIRCWSRSRAMRCSIGPYCCNRQSPQYRPAGRFDAVSLPGIRGGASRGVLRARVVSGSPGRPRRRGLGGNSARSRRNIRSFSLRSALKARRYFLPRWRAYSVTSRRRRGGMAGSRRRLGLAVIPEESGDAIPALWPGKGGHQNMPKAKNGFCV